MPKRTLTLLLLLLAVLGYSQKQPPAKDRYPTFLLNYPALQKELQLSPVVVKKIAQIQKDGEKRYLAMISPKPTNPNQLTRPSLAQVQAEQAKTDDTIVALLSKQQKERLRQVGLQYGGMLALGDRRVFASLKITADQERKLREASIKEEKVYANVVRQASTTVHLSPKNPVSPKERMVQMAQARVKMMKALQKDAEKILTPTQVAQWKAMLGKPFPVETLYMPLVTKNVH